MEQESTPYYRKSCSQKIHKSDSRVIQKQLHGYCDASQEAYGAVVYLRSLHQDSTVTVSLVTSKTKVAPLNGSTIPRLELSGALLLARLVQQTGTFQYQIYSLGATHP